VSVIDELPPGRKPIKTIHRFDNNKPLSLLMRNNYTAPDLRGLSLIQESEKMDYKTWKMANNTPEAFPGVP
jgi:ATP-dependent DNA helicase RecG